MLHLFNRLYQNISKGREEELFKQPYYGPLDPNLDDPLWFFDSYCVSLTIHDTNHTTLSDNDDCYYTFLNGKLKMRKTLASYHAVTLKNEDKNQSALQQILDILTEIQVRAREKCHTVNVLKINVSATRRLPLLIKLKLKKMLIEYFQENQPLPCLILIGENNIYQDLITAMNWKSLIYRTGGKELVTVDNKILSSDFLHLDAIVKNLEDLQQFRGRGLVIGKCRQNQVPVDVFLKQFLCWRTGSEHLSIFGVHDTEKLGSSYEKVWYWLVEQADETGSLVEVRLLFARFKGKQEVTTVYWNGRAIFMVIEKEGVYQGLAYIVSFLQEEF